MKNISFALTTQQILDSSKSVTRRLGWKTLKPGTLLRPCRKCMGLKKGEKVDVLRTSILVVNVSFEPLLRMLQDKEYGKKECELEGFPSLTPEQFVLMFCGSHKGCTPDTILTRIQFDYT